MWNLNSVSQSIIVCRHTWWEWCGPATSILRRPMKPEVAAGPWNQMRQVHRRMQRYSQSFVINLVTFSAHLQCMHAFLTRRRVLWDSQSTTPAKAKFGGRYSSPCPLLPHCSTDRKETQTRVFLLSGERRVDIHETANRAQPNSAHGQRQPRPLHGQRGWKALLSATHECCLIERKLTSLRMS